MNMLKAPDSRNLAILFITAIVMVVLYGQINYGVEPFSDWDLSAYRHMASVSPSISSDISQPFAYRVLGPFLVGMFPIPNPLGFYALAVAFSLCLVVQFYCLLRYIGLSSAVSLVTVLLFMFNKYLFGYTIWNYFQINDLLSLNFMIVLFFSMWRNQWVVFGITLVLGAMTREVSMLAIPVMFTYLLEQNDLFVKWRKAVGATIPGLLVFILIRVFVPTAGGHSLLDAFLVHSSKLYSPESVYRLLVNSVLPLSFIPILFLKPTLHFFKTRKYALLYVSLIFLSAMFGSNNERLMAPVFIIFYMLIGIIIQDLDPEAPFLVFLIGAGFANSLDFSIARWPLPNINWAHFFKIGSTLAVTICMYLLKRRRHMQWREIAGLDTPP